MDIMKKLYLLLICLVLSSCGGVSAYKRVENAENMISKAGFAKNISSTDNFFIFNLNNKGRGKTAKIYIEGDGFAWKNIRTISNDPTPNNPVAMKMALNDESPLVIYIARPCQYTMPYGYEAYCKKDVWTHKRFSHEALSSINQVIDKYKHKFKFKDIELIGFSGGGTISMLLPTLRDDITKITTYAGNLDIDQWTEHHNITPLNGSMNPADFKEYSLYIPQVHYVGTQDTIVPKYITEGFIENMYDAKIIEVDTNHGEWE